MQNFLTFTSVILTQYKKHIKYYKFFDNQKPNKLSIINYLQTSGNNKMKESKAKKSVYLLNVRLNETLLKSLEEASAQEQMAKSTLARNLILKGLRNILST